MSKKAKPDTDDDDFLLEDDAVAEVGEEEVDETIPARVTVTTILLCLLNIVAACSFLYLLLLDYQRRQIWSYEVFKRDLYIQGLPLEEEEHTLTGSRELRPPVVIDGEVLQREFTARKSGARADKFQSINEVLRQRIIPSELHPAILAEHFKNLPGEPVQTLQDEVKGVQGKLLKEIETAAATAAKEAGTEAQKRDLVAKVLLPLARNGFQIEAMNLHIQAVKGAGLDKLLQDACERRMICDILQPLDEFRATDTKDKRLHDAVDVTKVPLEQLKEALNERFTEADAKTHWDGRGRESWEKRRAISFLLLTVSQVKTPTKVEKGKLIHPGELLYPKGSDRVEAVVGLEEHIQAVASLAAVTQKMRDRLWRQLTASRDGRTFVSDGGTTGLQHEFVGQHADSIKRILDTVALIKNRAIRLGVLKDFETRHQKQYDERKQHHDEMLADLIKARAETARTVVELRRLEQQLFAAQLEFAEAAETNQRLEAEIRLLELYPHARRQP